MIDVWLDLSILWLVLVAVVVFSASAILLNWISFHSPAAARVCNLRGVVAPFFTAVSLLFGLFLAFLASDVWERKTEGSRAVIAERNALAALVALASANAPEAGKINQAAANYLSAVIQDEWRQMRKQQSSSETADRLNQLLISVASRSSHYPAGVHNAMLQKTLAGREARSTRLSLSNDQAETLKWLSVLLLAFMSQIAIAAVHLDRTVPQRTALAIFTLAAVLTICVVAAYERPFDGPISVPPDPLTELLQAILPVEDSSS